METGDDPREFSGGEIAGPGGPHDEGMTVIDTRTAILLDTTEVAMVDNRSDGRRFCAMLLHGELNRSDDRVKAMFLLEADGMAAIVSELVAVARREGQEFADEFARLLGERMAAMP